MGSDAIRPVNAGNKNTQHAPSTKMKCDYLYGWIKKWSHTQKSYQNGEPQRSSWGTQKKKEKNYVQVLLTNLCIVFALFNHVNVV